MASPAASTEAAAAAVEAPLMVTVSQAPSPPEHCFSSLNTAAQSTPSPEAW